MVNEKETHFEHAKRIVKSWPKWKQKAVKKAITIPKNMFDMDGNLYR